MSALIQLLIICSPACENENINSLHRRGFTSASLCSAFFSSVLLTNCKQHVQFPLSFCFPFLSFPFFILFHTFLFCLARHLFFSLRCYSSVEKRCSGSRFIFVSRRVPWAIVQKSSFPFRISLSWLFTLAKPLPWSAIIHTATPSCGLLPIGGSRAKKLMKRLLRDRQVLTLPSARRPKLRRTSEL